MDPRQSELNSTPPTDPDYKWDTDPGAIENDIDHTRAEMDQTIDRLTDSLRPQHLIDSAMHTLGVDGQDASAMGKKLAGKTLEAAERHPVPAALLGAGVAWLAYELISGKRTDPLARKMSRSDGHVYGSEATPMHSGSYVDARTGEPYSAGGSYSSTDPASHDEDTWGRVIYDTTKSGWDKTKGAASSAKDKASQFGRQAKESGANVGHQASELGRQARESARDAGSRIRQGSSKLGHQASELGHSVSDHASTAAHATKAKAGQAADSARYAMREYPLSTGLALLAAGLAFGLAVPATRKEDELLGPARDQHARDAINQGKAYYKQARQAASAATATALEDARNEGLNPTALRDKVSHIARDAAASSKEAAREEGLTAEQLKSKASNIAKDASESAKSEFKKDPSSEKKADSTAGAGTPSATTTTGSTGITPKSDNSDSSKKL